jgi:hypothetical protein
MTTSPANSMMAESEARKQRVTAIAAEFVGILFVGDWVAAVLVVVSTWGGDIVWANKGLQADNWHWNTRTLSGMNGLYRSSLDLPVSTNQVLLVSF